MKHLIKILIIGGIIMILPFIGRNWNYWHNQVLPLVYDETLSYYEMLCKLRGSVQTLGDMVEDLDKEVALYRDLPGRMDNVDNYLNTVKPQITDILNQLPGIKTDLATLKTKVNEHTTVISDNTNQIVINRNAINAEMERLNRLVNDFNALVNRVTALETEVNAVKSRVQNLEILTAKYLNRDYDNKLFMDGLGNINPYFGSAPVNTGSLDNDSKYKKCTCGTTENGMIFVCFISKSDDNTSHVFKAFNKDGTVAYERLITDTANIYHANDMIALYHAPSDTYYICYSGSTTDMPCEVFKYNHTANSYEYFCMSNIPVELNGRISFDRKTNRIYCGKGSKVARTNAINKNAINTVEFWTSLSFDAGKWCNVEDILSNGLIKSMKEKSETAIQGLCVFDGRVGIVQSNPNCVIFYDYEQDCKFIGITACNAENGMIPGEEYETAEFTENGELMCFYNAPAGLTMDNDCNFYGRVVITCKNITNHTLFNIPSGWFEGRLEYKNYARPSHEVGVYVQHGGGYLFATGSRANPFARLQDAIDYCQFHDNWGRYRVYILGNTAVHAGIAVNGHGTVIHVLPVDNPQTIRLLYVYGCYLELSDDGHKKIDVSYSSKFIVNVEDNLSSIYIARNANLAYRKGDMTLPTTAINNYCFLRCHNAGLMLDNDVAVANTSALQLVQFLRASINSTLMLRNSSYMVAGLGDKGLYIAESRVSSGRPFDEFTRYCTPGSVLAYNQLLTIN